MKTKKKIRFLSLVLAVCVFMVSVNITAFAKDTVQVTPNSTGVYTEKQLNIIENERSKMLESIKMQLEQQDAMDQYEYFVSIFTKEFDSAYFLNNSQATRGIAYYAPAGGWIRAYDNQVEAHTEFLTTQNAETLYYESTQYDWRTALADIVMVGFGLLWNNGGLLVSVATIFNKLANDNMWANINLGTDPAMCVTTFDRLESRTTTVVGKWNSFPYMQNSYEAIGNITYDAY